ncbi:hypothetical protein MD484_g4018, partial [Candolleomyces efflorescens]
MLMEMIPVDAELPPTSTAITAFSLQDEDRMVEFFTLGRNQA